MKIVLLIIILIVLCGIVFVCWKNVQKQYNCIENGISIFTHNHILNKPIAKAAKLKQISNLDSALYGGLRLLYGLTLRHAKSTTDTNQELFVGFIDSLRNSVEIRNAAGEAAIELAIRFIKSQYNQYVEFMDDDYRTISNINFMDNILSDYDVVYREYFHDMMYDLSA